MNNILSSSLADDLKTYFNNAFSSATRITQLCVLGLLAVALIVFLILAIVNPSGRKKKKEAKLHALHDEVIRLKTEIEEISNECSEIDKQVLSAEQRAQDEISALTERERLLCENEIALDRKKRDMISELAVKQQLLSDLLHRQQSGLLKSMKKEDVSDTQKVLSSVEAQQTAHKRDIEKLSSDRTKRAEMLEKNIADLNRSLEDFKVESKVKKDSLLAKKAEDEKKLDELLLKNKYKLKNGKDGKPTEDAIKQERELKENELKALEELRIAKAEYELACKRRQQAEKNKQIAVENAKAEAEELRKARELLRKKPSRAAENEIAATEPTPIDNDDVQLIIADLEGDGTPRIVESPITTDTADESPADTTTETITSNDDKTEQLSFDDEVVFTESEVEDIKYDDKAKSGFTDVISNREEKDYSPAAALSKTVNTTDGETTAAATEKSNQTDSDEGDKVKKASFIDGFSSEEPASLWKIVPHGDKFIAFLTVNGRKIAHTDEYLTVPAVKSAIRSVAHNAVKRTPEVSEDNGSYSFTLCSSSGKTLLFGEKQFEKSKAEADAATIQITAKTQIKIL